MATIEELTDYTIKNGASLYERGIKTHETHFIMKSSQVVFFEKELQDMASMMGWDKGAQTILKYINMNGRPAASLPSTTKLMSKHL